MANNYTNVKKGTKTGLAITTVLCILILILEIVGLINGLSNGKNIMAVHAAFSIVMSAFVLCYAFVGYKKPHGNMLRVLYFVFAVYLQIMAVTDAAGSELYVSSSCLLFSALLVSYVSGRLNKIEKNKKLLVLVGILLLAAWICTNFIFGPGVVKPIRILGSLSNMIVLAALGCAYIARYEEHKEAGLEDKK